jgi:hypothetical protein
LPLRRPLFPRRCECRAMSQDGDNTPRNW